jgi:hypothetical protein
MIAPRLVHVVGVVASLFLVAGFALTLVMKVRHAGNIVDQEEQRRPASMRVDPLWPDWFRNMDRNSSGDLSREEFIGPDDQFKRYDTNGDRVISPQEAVSADADFLSQVPP